DEDGAEVLRVNDLGAARHLEHDVGEGGAQHHEAAARRRPDRGSLGTPDHVIVGDDAGMGVEERAGMQRHEISPLLGVDQQYALSGRQGARESVGLARHSPPVDGAGVERSPTAITSRWPGSTRPLQATLSRLFKVRRTIQAAPATANQMGSPPRPRRMARDTRKPRIRSTGPASDLADLDD